MERTLSTARRLAGTSSLHRIVAVLVVLSIPLFLLTESVSWAFNDLRLYTYGFDRFGVSKDTGIPREDLVQVARTLRNYFNSPAEPLSVRARVHGVERELFTPREVAHMRDVKVLVRRVYAVAVLSGAVLVLGSLFLALSGPAWRRRVPLLIAGGSALTLGLLTLAGAVAFTRFDWAFLLFHRLSFANDFWQLDPARHYLVRLFPEGFWFSATAFVALATVAQAVILGALALLWRWAFGGAD